MGWHRQLNLPYIGINDWRSGYGAAAELVRKLQSTGISPHDLKIGLFLDDCLLMSTQYLRAAGARVYLTDFAKIKPHIDLSVPLSRTDVNERDTLLNYAKKVLPAGCHGVLCGTSYLVQNIVDAARVESLAPPLLISGDDVADLPLMSGEILKALYSPDDLARRVWGRWKAWCDNPDDLEVRKPDWQDPYPEMHMPAPPRPLGEPV